MKGIILKKAQIIAEDDRRKIISILNGEIGVRDIHLLEMKKGEQILGNHYHTYPEVCYCYKGEAHYILKNRETEEKEEMDMKEGDVMFRDAYITHTCIASEDCVLIDGAGEMWLSDNWNHYQEKLK